jgi:hypothetical protein
MTNNNSDIEMSYNLLLEKQKTNISKKSLENIKVACDKLLSLNATITTTSVAEFIADIDNLPILESINNKTPPKKQSIRNNDGFKTFISLYQCDMDNPDKKNNDNGQAIIKYPSQGLDSKTKAYINMLVHVTEAVKNENKSLSEQLTVMTKTTPISLLESEGAGAGNTNEMALVKPMKAYPFSMEDLVSIVNKIPALAASFPHIFKIVEREGKCAMSIDTPSKTERIFNSKEMELINACSKGS